MEAVQELIASCKILARSIKAVIFANIIRGSWFNLTLGITVLDCSYKREEVTVSIPDTQAAHSAQGSLCCWYLAVALRVSVH